MNKTKKFQLKKEIAQDCVYRVYRRLSLFPGGGMQIVPPPFYFFWGGSGKLTRCKPG